MILTVWCWSSSGCDSRIIIFFTTYFNIVSLFQHIQGIDIYERVQFDADPNQYFRSSEYKCGFIRGPLGLGGGLSSTEVNSSFSWN